MKNRLKKIVYREHINNRPQKTFKSKPSFSPVDHGRRMRRGGRLLARTMMEEMRLKLLMLVDDMIGELVKALSEDMNESK